jgi:DNA mismatch repair protein MutS
MSRSSPMMEQYRKVKELHPDKLLMFQVGDFYELFFEDAELAARELDIVLTSRDSGSADPIPLAGVPIHAVDNYLNKLINKGYKVVICDQVENPTQAKGLVRREITRILTPGTISEAEMLDEGKNNYLAVIVNNRDAFGLATIDISTGDFQVTEQSGGEARDLIIDELKRLEPAEVLCANRHTVELCQNFLTADKIKNIAQLQNIPGVEEAKALIDSHWKPDSTVYIDPEQHPLALIAAATTLDYLQKLKQLPRGVLHFRPPELYFNKRFMFIDNITSRNLELTESITGGHKYGNLLVLIDHCLTGMGKRLLKKRLEQPLTDLTMIENRLNAVEELVTKPLARSELRSILNKIFDLERFCSKLAYQRVNARDLVALKNTLNKIKPLKLLIVGLESSVLVDLANQLPEFNDLIAKIENALLEEPPLALKEGGLFREGYNAEADRLRLLTEKSSKMILDFEKNERSKTGIKSLRVGFNRNFGYYIEITKNNVNLVPPEYHRKQTLVGAERYTTEVLHNLEEQISGAREKLFALEYFLFEELRELVSNYTGQLVSTANLIAEIDFRQSLAETAEKNNYCRPQFSADKVMLVKQARHPVVEKIAFEQFVANDIMIDKKNYILLITGPNMAGKSTYIRSVALVAVLAQMGSFVPADKALVPIYDRIFARVGASDDLSRGHSTFMVEMIETATILKEATSDSLIILDEIGRGTSTYDGMSIARSVIEYIADNIKAKTLFSTHYHELTRLENDLQGVKNYSMAVKEKGKEVLFLRQIVPGRADKSYGINVARLAGLPLEVLIRAETVLSELELAASTAAEQQLSLLPIISNKQDNEAGPSVEIIERLKEYDLNHMTPIEAMKILHDMQKELFELENR